MASQWSVTGMTTELCGEISVCVDCMFMHANGEIGGDPADRREDQPEPWALWGFGYGVFMGGKHQDGCDPESDECDCEDLGFSWASCEGCGSNLGGDRHLFTTWRTPVDVARAEYRAALVHAALMRRDAFPAAAREAMAYAERWRRYLLPIAAEQRRHGIWMRRIESERAAQVAA